MASHFTKISFIVEAFQMTEARRASNSEWPKWMNEAWQKDGEELGSLRCVDFPNSDGTDKIEIRNADGVTLVEWGDWIIQGARGEIYACKPDVFEFYYQPFE